MYPLGLRSSSSPHPPSQHVPPPPTLNNSSPQEAGSQPLWKRVLLFVLKILFHILTLGIFLIIDHCFKYDVLSPPETPFSLPKTPQLPKKPLDLLKFFPQTFPTPVPISIQKTMPTYGPLVLAHPPGMSRSYAWELSDSLLDLYKKQAANNAPRAALPFLTTLFGIVENLHFVSSYPVYLMQSFQEVGLIDRFLKEPSSPEEEWLFPKIVEQVCYLDNKYFLINVSGDGNCFYRSFAIGWLVSLISNPGNPKALREEIQKLEALPFTKASEKNAELTRRVVAILKLCFRKRKISFLFDEVILSSPMTDVIMFLRELSYFSASQERKSSMTEANAKQLILLQLNDDPSYLQQALTTLSEFSPCSAKIQGVFLSPDALLNSSQLSPCDELLLMCRFFKKLSSSNHKDVAPLTKALGITLNTILSPISKTIASNWPTLFANTLSSSEYKLLEQNTPYLSTTSRLYVFLESLPASSFDSRIEAFLEKVRNQIRTYSASKLSLRDLLSLRDSTEHSFYQIKERLIRSLFRKDFFLRSMNALLTTVNSSLPHSEHTKQVIKDFLSLLNENFSSLYEANREIIHIQQQELLTEEYLLGATPGAATAEQDWKKDFNTLTSNLNIKNLDPLVLDFLFLINSPTRAEKVLKSRRCAALLNTFSYLYNATAAELLENTSFKNSLKKACLHLCLTQRYASDEEALFTQIKSDGDKITVIKNTFSHPEITYSQGLNSLLDSCWAILAQANSAASRLMSTFNNEHKQKLDLYKQSLKVLSSRDGAVWGQENILHKINDGALLYAFLLNHPGVVDENRDAAAFLTRCKALCNQFYPQLEESLPSKNIQNKLLQKRLSEAIFFQKLFIQNSLYKSLLENLLTDMPLDDLDKAFVHSVSQAETEHVAALSRELAPFAICQFLGTDEAINPYNFSLELTDQVSLLTRTQGFISLYAPEEEASIRLLRLSNHYCCLLPIEKEETEKSQEP
ncbi:hypothetical protein [Chlamydiifrater phoenicopteri]|uniref:hypothetical protein n=1 Tax=Chlamydiifrater phoenicopteri TaxID=2681469 RepID=UPI001BCCD225|nr:hypothetical protein [Chlamydiifrater phoenicopteri]